MVSYKRVHQENTSRLNTDFGSASKRKGSAPIIVGKTTENFNPVEILIGNKTVNVIDEIVADRELSEDDFYRIRSSSKAAPKLPASFWYKSLPVTVLVTGDQLSDVAYLCCMKEQSTFLSLRARTQSNCRIQGSFHHLIFHACLVVPCFHLREQALAMYALSWVLVPSSNIVCACAHNVQSPCLAGTNFESGL